MTDAERKLLLLLAKYVSDIVDDNVDEPHRPWDIQLLIDLIEDEQENESKYW